MALLPSDPQTQKKLLLGVAPLVLALLYWQFYHGKLTAQVSELESRLEQLETKNRTARAQAAQGGPELEQKLALYEEHMSRLEELVPSSDEVPELLHAMTLEARATNVELALMRPEGETPVGPRPAGPAAPAGRPGGGAGAAAAQSPGAVYYTRQVYQVSVIGGYQSVGSFLAAVGSLPRIVTPIDLRLTPARSREEDESGALKLEASFRIQTYVLPNTPPPESKPNVRTS
ncbi:MAG TPA: type 4a pilus biogenesis protein PilO [Longimicrobiales bacterium]